MSVRIGPARALAFVCLALSLAGCSGGSPMSSTSPTTPTTTAAPTGAMSATLDGVPWTASQVVVLATGGVFSITGTDPPGATQTLIGFAVPAVAGNYKFGQQAGGQNAGVITGVAHWTADQTNGTGAITVDASNAHSASGTFAFAAVPTSGGAAGTRVVTNGVFSVAF